MAELSKHVEKNYYGSLVLDCGSIHMLEVRQVPHAIDYAGAKHNHSCVLLHNHKEVQRLTALEISHSKLCPWQKRYRQRGLATCPQQYPRHSEGKISRWLKRHHVHYQEGSRRPACSRSSAKKVRRNSTQTWFIQRIERLDKLRTRCKR